MHSDDIKAVMKALKKEVEKYSGTIVEKKRTILRHHHY